MSQTQWTPEGRAVWAKLEGFQFDTTNDNNNTAAVFGFEARLAKENGWSRAFTSRVIQEYRRFLLLAMQAGHPVTPSDEVDQAWHLHLVYTRSYWERLCRGVLGRPLHHEPTKGGVDESAKFQAQYERTLNSYRRLFGNEPPADIWPDARTCLKPKRHQRVDKLRHWLLPKPEWIARLRLRHLQFVATAALVAFGVAGCQAVNVLDWHGPEFLTFYVIGFSLALAISLIGVRVSRNNMQTDAPYENPSDPYEVAFLGGGARRMVDAALAALYARHLLKLEKPDKKPAKLGAASHQGEVRDLHPIEKRVFHALPRTIPSEVRLVRESLAPLGDEMQQRLTSRGLLLSEKALTHFRFLASFPLLVMMALGATKCFVGFERGKPVGYLLFCLVASLVVLGLRLHFVKRRTNAGEEIWSNLSRFTPSHLLNCHTSDVAFDSTTAALTVALAGTAGLATLAYQPLYDVIHRPGVGNDSSSGCGSSGCGSGCGGGGCGGGGCGGCGGGD